MFHSFAQQLAQRTALDLFHTVLVVPDGLDRGTLIRCLMEVQPTNVGILPRILTLKEFMQQMGNTDETNDFFTLLKRILDAFPGTPFVQAAYQAQFLLQLQIFCKQFGRTIDEPPFPLLLFSEHTKQLIALVRREQPSLLDQLRMFFQKHADDSFLWLDLFPTLSAFDTLRTAFQEAKQEIWSPREKLPKAVSTQTFSSIDQEAASVVRIIASLPRPLPTLAIVTDHRALLQKIEAELLSAQIPFKKPSSSTLADSFWGEALLAVASWMARPGTPTLVRMGTFFVRNASPTRTAWFRAFVEKIASAPSFPLKGDLWIPSQADETALRFILAHKEGADSLISRGFKELAALRPSFEQKASWSERVQAHQATWKALTIFWSQTPNAYPDLEDFFEHLRDGEELESISHEDYETVVRLLMNSIQAPEDLAPPESSSVLLLSSQQALLYDYKEVFFVGMNEGEGLTEKPFPSSFEKPEAWDFAFQNALMNQAVSDRTVVMTRTQRADARPHFSFHTWSNVPETVDSAVWGPKELVVSVPPEPLSAARAFVPQNARPHTLAVSDLQRLQDDPYAFFARKILRLYPMTSSSLTVDYGRWAHEVLHCYFHEGAWIQGLTLTHFFNSIQETNPVVTKRFKPRLRPILERLETDLTRRFPHNVQTETRLEMVLSVDNTHFTVYGIADRIDTKDQDVTLIDYKTGMLPPESSLQKLDTLQLPIEAFLLKRTLPSSMFFHMRLLSLKYDPGQTSEVCLSFSEGIEAQAETRLKALLSLLTQEDFVFETPFTASKPCLEYQHLKRVP